MLDGNPKPPSRPVPVSLPELTPEQAKDLKGSARMGWEKGFNVRGSDRRIYRILYLEDCNNIVGEFVFFGKRYYYLLGRNPKGWVSYPLAECRFIAQKVHLECNAKPFRNEDYACRVPVDAGGPIVTRMLRMGDYEGKI